jgi:RNA polymerase sigma factor (TIGR02999 family)
MQTVSDSGGSSPHGSDVLEALRSGDREALDSLVPLLYDELRAIAHRHLARGRRMGAQDGTLATTALVNEAYLKLVDQRHAKWNDRAHFLALVAIAMRQILIDRARAQVAEKRGGGGVDVTLDDAVIAADRSPARLLEVDEALQRLAAVEPRLAWVVECRFFGGLSEEEIAEALSVTVRTVQRDWVKARALLRRALGEL